MNPSNLVAVDVETSGLNPFTHQLLAVGLCPFRNSVAPTTIYVRHNKIAWSPQASRFFERYQADWEREAVEPAKAIKRIEAFFANVSANRPAQLVGHNVAFDLGFLKQLASQGGKDELEGVSHRTLDTHTMLFLLNQLGLIPSAAMTSDGALKHFGVVVDDSKRHTALGDAIATRQLLQAIFELFGQVFDQVERRNRLAVSDH